MSRHIVLYTAPMCGDCQHLKAFMEAHGIAHETRNVREDSAYLDELRLATGKEGVPYLKIDGRWVRGYDVGKPFSDEFARRLFGL